MTTHHTNVPDWPVSRRVFLQRIGIVAGSVALFSGTGLGQEDENREETHGEPERANQTPPPDEFTTTIDNRYFPLPVGRRLLLKGEESGTPVTLQVTVLDETEIVGEVTTRVVEEREWEDGALIEVSRNYYAQSSDGDVWYFGEAVDIYEDGKIVSHEGAWRAYESGNQPGVFMPGDPVVGMQFQQERAPGIAVDKAIVVGIGQTIEVPAGTFENTLQTYDWNPLESGTLGDIKAYAPDLGIIIDGPVELVEFTE